MRLILTGSTRIQSLDGAKTTVFPFECSCEIHKHENQEGVRSSDWFQGCEVKHTLNDALSAVDCHVKLCRRLSNIHNNAIDQRLYWEARALEFGSLLADDN